MHNRMTTIGARAHRGALTESLQPATRRAVAVRILCNTEEPPRLLGEQ